MTRGTLRSAHVLALLFASGCIAIRDGSLPAADVPSSSGELPSVAVRIVGQSTQNGGATEIGPVFQVWQAAALRAYRDSGRFSSVTSGLAPADLRAEITITAATEFDQALTVVNGGTLGLVPNVMPMIFTVETALRDPGGNVLGRAARSERITVVVQLLLLPLMPFLSRRDVQDEVVYDLNRAVLGDVLAQRALQAAAPPEP